MAEAWTRFLPSDLPPERVTACLGLISDTHMPDRCPALTPALFDMLQDVDVLLHAGDVGELWVLDRLSAIAPVVAVHGNDETTAAQRELPYQQLIAIGGQRILLTHAHYPDRAEELASRRDDSWEPKLERRAAMARRAGASIIVFGHTHIPMRLERSDVLLINPGAIASGSYTTRQRIQTIALLFVCGDGPPWVIHVDLANPKQPFTPRIDWPAGFRVALDQFSASILDPALEAQWERLLPFAEEAPDLARAVLRRTAYPCWSGEQELINVEDLARALRAEPNVPASQRAKLEAALADDQGVKR